MDNSIVVILGGVVTAGAGLIMDARREQRRLKKISAMLKNGIGGDLARALPLYDKLIAEWQSHGTLDSQTLQTLAKAAATYYSNPEWLSLFDELGCSKAVYEYHSHATKLLGQIEHQCGDLCGLDDARQECRQARAALEASMTELHECRNQAQALYNLLYAGQTEAAA